MLAQNFKTATDLGISEDEVGALIKVLGMLERGEISPAHFDMTNFVRRKPHCGTIGCICGWANIVSHQAAFPEVQRGGWHTAIEIERTRPISLLNLFWIRGYRTAGADWREFEPKQVTPARAAIALRGYLTTGEPNWKEALTT